MLRNTFTAALALTCQSALAKHYFDGMGRVHLKMNDDNHFKVMQLTDLHLGESRTNLDYETLQMIEHLIDKEQPDFIAITGDIVSGQAWNQKSKSFWKTNYKYLADILTAKQVPYGIVPGFHDFEADVDIYEMMEIDSAYKYSAALPNYFEYYGNEKASNQFTYEVPIESNANPGVSDARLWFFGTGRANCYGRRSGMDCIRRDQIEWFKEKSNDINASESDRPNGLAFMHHALQEHMQLVNHYPVHGQKRDLSRCQGINTGLFSEIQQLGTVQWVSAGGDHSSDFWGTYGGINLAHGRKTGFASFGPKFVQRGARIFDMHVDMSTGEMKVETYIRQQDGEIEEQLELHDPPLISYLKTDHCLGSEDMDAASDVVEQGWLPAWSMV